MFHNFFQLNAAKRFVQLSLFLSKLFQFDYDHFIIYSRIPMVVHIQQPVIHHISINARHRINANAAMAQAVVRMHRLVEHLAEVVAMVLVQMQLVAAVHQMPKNVHCVTVPKRYKDFMFCQIANILRAAAVWRVT